MCDSADTGNTCRYYFKKEKESRQPPVFVPNPFPCITLSRTLPPMELFLEWGRHHLSHRAGFEWHKTQPGSPTPCDGPAGDKASPGESCQLFSSLPIPSTAPAAQPAHRHVLLLCHSQAGQHNNLPFLGLTGFYSGSSAAPKELAAHHPSCAHCSRQVLEQFQLKAFSSRNWWLIFVLEWPDTAIIVRV